MYINDSPIMPFKLSDELYHIGGMKGPSYLLDCGECLVLIDTSCPDNTDYLIENITSLGYDVKHIKHIIHSHGHYDHYGCTNELVALTGAKTYGGVDDLDFFQGGDPYNRWGEKIAFTPDVLLRDGDVLKFGDHEIRFMSTPGHSPGVMSMFLTLHVDGVPYLGGMFGGSGLAPFHLGHYPDADFTRLMRKKALEAIDRMMQEPVKIHIGNHLGNNKSLELLEYKGEGNPFLLFNNFHAFLEERRAQILEIAAAEP